MSGACLQAKLHVALDLGEAGGDQGYTFGEGPVAAAGIKSGSKTAHPTKEIEMQGMHADDESLHHNAAQVGPHAELTHVRQTGRAVLHRKASTPFILRML